MASTLSLYRRAPWPVRWHVAVRWRLFPFERLLPYVPEQGVFLDVGCGFGIWAFTMALYRPRAYILGCDPDERKIQAVQALVPPRDRGRVQFQIASAESIRYPAARLISFIDVLYLLPEVVQEEILVHAVQALERGGRLLVKEMDTQPAWKVRWNWLQETLVVGLLRWTYGQPVFHFRCRSVWEDLLKKMGLKVTSLRMDQGYPYPHLLIVGEKL
ncbi:class I SAM-dependent methyltransferase [Candidatus Parcubacteria bacterium]|nr:MAG: class I SAM-dependent methyltransferase [Candidatus Parcubacteria bacterium]